MKDRKAFNFYRSYWETAKKLEGEDRLKFYDALLEKQFLNKDPKLEGLSDLVYTSQQHSIESQVSGYLSKIQSLKEKPPQGGGKGGGKGVEEPPSLQEKEKVQGKEKVQEILNPPPKKITKKEAEEAFIDWFNAKRSKALNTKSNLKALSDTDKRNLHKLRESYNGEDFNKAFDGMIKNGWAKDNDNLTPKHFLVNDNFNRYYLLGEGLQQEKPKSEYEEYKAKNKEMLEKARRGEI